MTTAAPGPAVAGAAIAHPAVLRRPRPWRPASKDGWHAERR